MAEQNWENEVLTFWFSELREKDWFVSSKEIDDTIVARFKSVHENLMADPTPPANASPQWSLAAVIVLDQFSRNMFRGTEKAFASDVHALTIAKQAVASAQDKNMTDNEKQFLYMPFMHSENADDQAQCVALFETLGRAKYALEHKAVIDQFGRFPHRNAVLGRENTAEETTYLKDAKRYGQ